MLVGVYYVLSALHPGDHAQFRNDRAPSAASRLPRQRAQPELPGRRRHAQPHLRTAAQPHLRRLRRRRHRSGCPRHRRGRPPSSTSRRSTPRTGQRTHHGDRTRSSAAVAACRIATAPTAPVPIPPISRTARSRSRRSEAPVRILRYGLMPDTGGAGAHRGGMAQVLEFCATAPDAFVTARNRDRSVFQPWGVLGGEPGAAGSFTLNPGTRREQRSAQHRRAATGTRRRAARRLARRRRARRSASIATRKRCCATYAPAW